VTTAHPNGADPTLLAMRAGHALASVLSESFSSGPTRLGCHEVGGDPGDCSRGRTGAVRSDGPGLDELWTRWPAVGDRVLGRARLNLGQ
jgi:hypothetical protein